MAERADNPEVPFDLRLRDAIPQIGTLSEMEIIALERHMVAFRKKAARLYEALADGRTEEYVAAVGDFIVSGPLLRGSDRFRGITRAGELFTIFDIMKHGASE